MKEEVTPRQTKMALSWHEVNQAIVLPPVQSNETLSAAQIEQKTHIDELDLCINRFQEVVEAMGLSLDTLQQEFFTLQGQQAENSTQLQHFLTEKRQEMQWEQLTQAPVIDAGMYHVEATEWLSDIENETGTPASHWIQCLARAALADYTAIIHGNVALEPWEKACCTLTDADQTLITSAPTFFPLKKSPYTARIEWVAHHLKHYFLSIGLWQVYQLAKEQPLQASSMIWRTLPFIEPHVQLFLTYGMPQQAVKDLLLDWQTGDELDTNLKKNIETIFVAHNKEDCACYFCEGRRVMATVEADDILQIEKAISGSFLAPIQGIRWMRLLPSDQTRSDFHPGFSPHQPRYTNTPATQKATFQAVAWHWSEDYLSDLLWWMFFNEVKLSAEVNHKQIVALVPHSLNHEMMDYEEAQWGDAVYNQLLQDQSYYIQSMLEVLTLENPENIDAHRWLATFEEALKVQSLCHEKIKQKAKIRYQTLFDQPCSSRFEEELNAVLDEESPLLDDGFLSLQDGENIDALLAINDIRSDSMVSVEELQRRHRLSAYKEPGQSRKHHLIYVNQSWEGTQESIKKYRQELENLTANDPLETRWEDAKLSKEEVMLLLTMLIEALELRQLVILNYVQGSHITQADFLPEFWEQANLNTTLSTSLLQRKKTSPGTSPITIDRDSTLSARLTQDGFKPAVTPYEVWVRAQLLHQALFWIRIEKKYAETEPGRKGVAWSDYKASLAAVIETLPSLNLILENRIGRTKTQVLILDLMVWEKTLRERKAQIEACMSSDLAPY